MYKTLKTKIKNKIQFVSYNIQLQNIKESYKLKNLDHSRLDLLQMIQSIKSYISEFDILIDIGANEGEFAKTMRWFINFKSIIAIEPNEKLNPKLNLNLSIITDVKILNKALSNKVNETSYYHHQDSQMNSLIPSDSSLLLEEFGDREVQVEKIQTSTLDIELKDILPKQHELKIFLKLDTQGNELDILNGGISILEKTSYCLIEHMSNTPYKRNNNLEDIFFKMHSFGFKCLGPVYLKKRKNFQIGAVNYLFIKI